MNLTEKFKIVTKNEKYVAMSEEHILGLENLVYEIRIKLIKKDLVKNNEFQIITCSKLKEFDLRVSVLCPGMPFYFSTF